MDMEERESGLVVPKGISYTPKTVHPPKGQSLIGIQGKSLHPLQFSTMVRNIEHQVRSASDEDIASGMVWYPKGQEIAGNTGRGDVRMGAGIIAALSPQKRWDLNIKIAEDMMRTGKAGHTAQQVSQARRIREGEDPSAVLPMTKKTGHFYRNLYNPSDPEPVTIDRHAHASAVNKRAVSVGGEEPDLGLQTIGRYNTFVNAHVAATHRLADMGVTIPNQTQAIAWVNWRRQHGIVD